MRGAVGAIRRDGDGFCRRPVRLARHSLFAAIVTALRPRLGGLDHRRRRIRDDLELLAKLPTSMPSSREQLEKLIGRDVAHLVRSDLEERREPGTAVSSAVAAIALGALTVWIAQGDGWWIIVAVVPGLVAAACAYLFVVSLRKVHRDSGGTPLRPEPR